MSSEHPCSEHCSACINIHCQGRMDCLVEACKCGIRLHECKMEEHRNYTCSSQLIDCINQINGCIEKIIRKDLTEHLKICPVNIFYCICCSELIHRSVSDHHMEHNKHAYNQDKSCNCEDITCACGDTMKKCSVTNHEMCLCPSYLIDCSNKANGCPEKVPRSQMKNHLLKCPANFFVCLDCFGLTRRADVNHHSDLFSLNDKVKALNHLCPYRIYGCEFDALDEQLTEGSVKWKIDENNHHLILSQHPAMVPSESNNFLTALPVDVIDEILIHLDSSALNSLSMVSKYCRKMCQGVLRKRGIVSFKWTLNKEKNTWTKRKMWSFASSSNCPPAKLKVSNAIAKHLETCPVSEKMKPNYVNELPERVLVMVVCEKD